MRHTFAAFVLAGFGAMSSARAEVVFNGGFETGDFFPWIAPPWVLPPQPNPQLFYVTSAGGSHSGEFHARLSSTQQRYIGQVLPTTAGQDYELSFWMRKGTNVSMTFTVRWEGVVIYQSAQSSDPVLTQWTQYTLPLHANITGSFLEFGQSVFPLEYHIDDVSVVQVPGPSSAAVFAAAGACAVRRRRREEVTE